MRLILDPFSLKMKQGLLRSTAIAICIAMLVLSTTGIERTDREKDLINTSIKASTDALAALSKFADTSKEVASKASTFLNKIPFQKVLGCLGAFGGFVSVLLAIIPKADTKEMKFLKEQFSKVDSKLDNIANKIDDVQSLIKHETQRAQYIKAENDILFAHKKLFVFLDKILSVNCSTKRECLKIKLKIGQEHMSTFNVERSLHMIIQGTYQKSSFGEPLFSLLVNYNKGDIEKLNIFENRILQLAVKAQQALLMYQKLTGSRKSIITSMSEWLKSIYKVRSEKFKYEKAIYASVETYIKDDVSNKKYQIGVSSNSQAALKVRHDLRKKWTWLDWIVLSFNKDGSFHYEIMGGSYANNPQSTKDRVIIASAIPKGTYERNKFAHMINTKQRMYNVVAKTRHIGPLYAMFKRILINRGLWRMIRLFLLTKTSNHKNHVDVAKEAMHNSLYYDEIVNFRWRCRHVTIHCSNFDTNIRIIAVFKSNEEINYKGCTRKCNGNGRCMTKPYTGTTFCACNPFYQGDNCESKMKIDVAESITKLFATAATIPGLVDIHFGVQDVKNELIKFGDLIGANLGNIESSIVSLERSIEASFKNLGSHIERYFKWSNVITIYNRPIEMLKHTIKKFGELPEGSDAIKRLADATLNPYRMSYWISKLNKLIIGRNDEVLKHKPIMQMVMEKYKDIACSDKYKSIMPTIWQQLNMLQFQGFLAWIRALTILNKPTDVIAKEYKRIVASQKLFLSTQTCKMNIVNSVNGNCNGEWNLYKGMQIDLKCKPNYFIHGNKTPTCEKPSQCCNCKVDPITQQCNSKGICECKPNFYGPKCGNKDCKWQILTTTTCSKSCSYQGKISRKRRVHITQYGKGKACTGGAVETKKCFEGSCTKVCKFEYTKAARKVLGSIIWYSTFDVRCSNKGWLKGFKMEALPNKHNYFRVRMECCQLNEDMCQDYYHQETFIIRDSYNGKAWSLDRLAVECNHYHLKGIMSGYYMYYYRSYRRYKFARKCCFFKTRMNIKCYKQHTDWTDDGKGQLYYLDRQNVSCKDRYFLNYFRLQRDATKTKWRYAYTCCLVNRL